MARSLMLTGPLTYVFTPMVVTEPIHKGEVVRFSDDLAERMLETGRINVENEFVCHWKEVGDDVKVDVDISSTDESKVEVKPKTVVVMSRVSQREKATTAKRVIKRTAAEV